MKRIELVGPSGTGKTYLARALLRRLGAQSDFFLQSDLHAVRLCEKWPALGRSLRLLRRLGLYGASHTLSKIVALRYRHPMLMADLAAGGEQWEQSLRVGIMAFSQGRAPSVEMAKLVLFLESFTQSLWAERSKREALVLFDEGLFQRVVSYSQLHTDDSEMIGRLLDALPMPAGVLFVIADDATITERLRMRDGEGNKFQNLIGEARAAIEAIKGHERAAKIPSLTVNLSSGNRTDLDGIASFVDRLRSDRAAAHPASRCSESGE